VLLYPSIIGPRPQTKSNTHLLLLSLILLPLPSRTHVDGENPYALGLLEKVPETETPLYVFI
jgi:hypothetical protein